MKEIEGYVCFAHRGKVRIIYGPDRENDSKHWENISTNNLSTFNSIDEAKVAQNEVVELPHIQEVILKNLKLTVSDTEKELESLKEEARFILLQYNDEWGEIGLFGKVPEDGPHFGVLPCQLLMYNGFQPFDNFESAKNAHFELSRQGALPVKIGVISLKDLDSD